MYVREDEMSQAFNFSVVNCPWEPAALRKVIRRTQEASDSVGAPATWVLSNHDTVRHSTRFGYPTGANTDNGIGVTDPQPDRKIGLTRALSATAFLAGLPGSIYLPGNVPVIAYADATAAAYLSPGQIIPALTLGFRLRELAPLGYRNQLIGENCQHRCKSLIPTPL